MFRTLSVNVQNGGYRCFGCDAHGDIVSFVMRRDGIGRRGSKKLGAWVDDGTVRRLPTKKEKPKSPIQLLAEAVINDPLKSPERIHRLGLRTEILTLVEIQADVSNRLGLLLRGSEPAYKSEVEDCWGAMSLVYEDLCNCEAAYMGAIGAEYLG